MNDNYNFFFKVNYSTIKICIVIALLVFITEFFPAKSSNLYFSENIIMLWLLRSVNIVLWH